MNKNIAAGICCSVTVAVVVAVVVPTVLLTAEKFKDTFMKRCLAYPGQQQKICERVWTIFEQAYVGKDDREVSAKSYSQLFTETPFNHQCGRTMFWSGTRDISQDLVHRFTKNRDYFYTLEDTLLGYVLNGLTWCGRKGSKETFTKCDKSPNAKSSFWEMASMRLAQYACEVATVMLDGEKPQPFYDKSTFGRLEVPNLQQGKVKQLTIVLITESNRNQCNNESVKNLENMVKSKGISSDCKEVTISHIEECIKRKKYKSCW